EKIKKKLESRGMAFTFYELNRKAYCRAGGKIIAAKIKGQWFINYSVPWWKEKTREFVEKMLKILPLKYKKAMLDAIDWLEKRPCARKRGLGTRLPFDQEWIIESLSDSTIYMAFYTIIHIIRKNNIKPDQLKPMVFDYVFYGKGDPEKIFAETEIPVEVLKEMRREFTYWYPVDQRHTGIAHISNHLSFFLYHHVALFPPEHWPRMISLNEMVIREGVKMSKSKGNVILLRDIAEKYSADLFRLYAAGAANLDTILDWREKEVEMVIDNLRRFKALAEKALKTECRGVGTERFIDKWFMSRFNRIIEEATNALENMEIRDYVQKAFYQVLSIIDHYRERTSSREALCMTKRILEKWIKLLNPVIPHLTEEIWSWMNGEGFLSFSEWPMARKEEIDEEAEALEDMVERLIDDIKNVLNVLSPKPTKAVIIVASPWKYEVVKLVDQGKQMKEIIQSIRDKYGLKGREKEIIDTIQQYKKAPLKEALIVNPKNEYKVLEEAKEYIGKKTKLEVTIMWEEEARSKKIPRAEKAYPLKPGIYLH
ncbi:MAG: class I tRNA ligase family protein, partial [Staphylothermus sp.]|nr:class I tRNA ligase family protein [Staphylothermus sp.]